MVLTDRTLKKLILDYELVNIPFNSDQVQCASIDFRLGNSFAKIDKRYNDNWIDFEKIGRENKSIQYDYKTVKDTDYFILEPKSFVLATTKEYFKLPKYVGAIVAGRSSIGRMGLFIENAGWVDPNFEGEITLELFNATDIPMVLKPNARIGQMIFFRCDDIPDNPYRGKYQGQKGATGSKIHNDEDFI